MWSATQLTLLLQVSERSALIIMASAPATRKDMGEAVGTPPDTT
jgi:hypothetical protein